MENNKNKRRFRLFDLQKEGKGVSKKQAEYAPGFKRFWATYCGNFSKLVSVNIFFVLGNFPLLFLIAALSAVSKNEIFLPLSDLFQNVNGLIQADGGMTPYKLSLFALEGLQNQTYAPTVITYIMYGIGALTLFTFGPVNAATAYIIRNMVSGEPVFVWNDFWYAFKRNVKQALPFGIFDVIINALLIFNVYTLITTTAEFFASLLFWTTIVISVVYFFMRYYIYVQMVTFKLSVMKIFKNSLYFTLLGLKRNFAALFGIILLLFFEVFFLFGSGGVLMPLAVAAPLTILFSTFAFMKVYASYYKIKEIMIDPYKQEHPEEFEDEEPEEAVMRDDVTERERLEEIKKRNGLL